MRASVVVGLSRISCRSLRGRRFAKVGRFFDRRIEGEHAVSPAAAGAARERVDTILSIGFA
jgi:hypothetical protein